MSDDVRRHYEHFPYPLYPLAASVRRCDTYALNLDALWTRFSGRMPPAEAKSILIAGCGSFSPYPFAVANPRIPITALDLSRRSLRRAHLHCLLHGRRNVTYIAGDICDRRILPGKFGLIDAYGVLHHLSDPLDGLRSLEERLVNRGIIRVMVYSRYARREEESIRRAFRIVKIRDVQTARDLLLRARPGSRLHRFRRQSQESSSVSGIADALLHPCVRTYRIDECLEMVAEAGLRPLLFGHGGACAEVSEEVRRIRRLEENGQSPGNFVLYLGRKMDEPMPLLPNAVVQLNPCLHGIVGSLHLRAVRVLSRLGHPNPPLGLQERRFLRRFRAPVPWEALSFADRFTMQRYLKALFLLQFTPENQRVSGG